MSAQIGDANRQGTAVIVDTRWDHNGTMFVTVRENVGGFASWRGGKAVAIRTMRSLARRAIAKPELTRSAQVVSAFRADGCEHATFAVTRLAD